ncbi:MAG TPA: hypothetical protein VIP46_19990 [Pyrinomonadaceae bacterium]
MYEAPVALYGAGFTLSEASSALCGEASALYEASFAVYGEACAPYFSGFAADFLGCEVAAGASGGAGRSRACGRASLSRAARLCYFQAQSALEN